MQVRSLDMHLPHDLNCKTEKKVILEAQPAHLETSPGTYFSGHWVKSACTGSRVTSFKKPFSCLKSILLQ